MAIFVGLLMLAQPTSAVVDSPFTGLHSAPSSTSNTGPTPPPPPVVSPLSYQLEIDSPAGATGAAEAAIPSDGDLLNYTITYDPSTNAVSSTVTDVTTGASTSIQYTITGPFSTPSPGTYLFGVGAGTGGGYANWAAKDISLTGSDGTTTVLSSAPNAIFHEPIYVQGSVTPSYDNSTGALVLIPDPSPFVWGLGVFPYVYDGGNLTLTLFANFTSAEAAPVASDGLEEYLFMSPDLVSSAPPSGLINAPPFSGNLPVVSGIYRYSIQGDVPWPQSSVPYFDLQWDPAWAERGIDTPEFNVWEPYPTGTFITNFSADPSAVAPGAPTNFTTNISGEPANLTYFYGGLPPGCVTQNASSLVCAPTTPGTYSVWVNVTGAGSWELARTNVTVESPSSGATAWNEFHGDAAHAGLSVSNGPTSPTVAWSAPTSAGTGGITVDGPYLLVTEAGGDGPAGGAAPYVFDASNGTSVGSLPSSTLGTGYSPAEGGVAYYESYSCFFFFCSCDLVGDWISNGSVLWEDGVGCAPSFNSEFGWSAASAEGGTVFYAIQGSGGLTAYSGANGGTEWSTGLPGGAWGTPTVGGDLVVVGYDNVDSVSAYYVSNGTAAWTVPINGTLGSSPAYANGVFYFGSTDGYAYAVSSDGSTLWNVAVGSAIEATPAVDGTTVIEADQGGSVLALNAANGATLWNFTTESGIDASPAISANGLVYDGNATGTLFALNERTGAESWQTTLSAAITSSPALADGMLFVLTADGTVSAFSYTSSVLALNVTVADSSEAPIANASVTVDGATALTNAEGEVAFQLPYGTYNVSASLAGYLPDSEEVTLHQPASVEMTLARPYDFLGLIPASHLNITETPTGYQISLLTMFPESATEIFFDWVPEGVLPVGSGWVNFSAPDVPSYIVMAADYGTPDYPDAYYANPSVTVLPPTDNGCGAFEDVAQDPWNPSISASPDPPVLDQPTTVSVVLYNSCPYQLNISELNFEISGLDAGGTGWSPIGTIYNITLAAGESLSESVIWSTQFDPALVGLHHCVRVYATYLTIPPPQCPDNYCPIQHNLDIEPNLLSGVEGSAHFVLGSVSPEAENASVTVTQSLPAGWSTSLTVNGATYPSPGTDNLTVAAGQVVSGTLTVIPDPATPGTGFINVSVSINGVLYGGFEKEMEELPIGHYGVAFQESGLPAGTPWSVTFNGLTHSATGATIDFNGTNGSYPFSIGPVTNYVASPGSGSLTVSGASAEQSITFDLADLGPQYCVSLSPGPFGPSAGLERDLEDGDYSASLNFSGGLNITPAISVCVGTNGALIPSPTFVNITESVTELATIKVNASGAYAYSDEDDPAVLAGPYPLGFICVAFPVCFDIQAEIDLEVNASLTAAALLEFDQGVVISTSQNYSFLTHSWQQVPTTESCVNSSASLATGCTTFIGSASIEGDLDVRLGPMVSIEADGLAGVFFYPYAELNLSAGFATSGGPVGSCGTASIGWDLAEPWAAACAAIGLEVGGNVLGDDFDTSDWTLFGDPVAASVIACNATSGACGSDYSVGPGAPLTLNADAAAGGAAFTWTSSCLSAPVEGSTLVFTDPDTGVTTCHVVLNSGFPLAVPALSLSETILTISVAPTYDVIFMVNELPSDKQHWSVSLNGDTIDPTGPSSVTFHVPNGTYPYVILGPYGYRVVGIPPAGNVTVNGTSVTIDGNPLTTFAFERGTTYRISFVEMGLPRFTEWCAAVGGTVCTDHRTLSFHSITPGEFPYAVSLVPGESVAVYLDGTEIPLSGWLSVTGHVRIVLRFTPDPSAPRGAGQEPLEKSGVALGRIPWTIPAPALSAVPAALPAACPTVRSPAASPRVPD